MLPIKKNGGQRRQRERYRPLATVGRNFFGVDLAEVPGVNFIEPHLAVVVDAGWITKDALCQGVKNGPAPCN